MSITNLLNIEDALDFKKILNPMDEKPKVSVLVPCFNHSLYIEECLNSIFSQKTDFVFEVIIGDDASTDDSLEKIEAVASNYNIPTKIFRWKSDSKWLRKGRPTGKLNFLRLYSIAQGQYVSTCDGDDAWITENKLQLQYDLLERSDYRMVYGKSLVGATPESAVLTDQPSGEFTLETIQFKNRVGTNTNTLIWRDSEKEETLKLLTSVFLLCPWLDSILQHIFLRNGDKAFILPETLGFYRQHATGVYSSLSARDVLLDKYSQLMFQEYFYQDSNKYREKLSEFIEFLYMHSVLTSLRSDPMKFILPLGRRYRRKLILKLLLNYWND